MNYILQETNTGTFEKKSRVKTTQPYWDETTSGTIGIGDFTMPSGSSIVGPAWLALRELQGQENADEAKKFLHELDCYLSELERIGIDINHVAPLRCFPNDDGSILVEWIFDDFRIGFNFEESIVESNWYFVSNARLGEINASGWLLKEEINVSPLISWLTTFVINHT